MGFLSPGRPQLRGRRWSSETVSFPRQSWIPSHAVASMLEIEEDSSALPLGVPQAG